MVLGEFVNRFVLESTKLLPKRKQPGVFHYSIFVLN
jgi:hypothetical protein